MGGTLTEGTLRQASEVRVVRATAIDLFSGAGGLSRGLQAAGFRILGAIESDDLAVESYHENFPATRIWHRDIRRVPVAEVRRELRLSRGQLDVLAGCPPCEGFSTMRTLNGHTTTDDPDNDLVLEMVRFVRGLRPKVVMVENVPALATDPRLMHFRSELEKQGYTVRCDVLNAAKYGVPQRRRRMLLVASQFGLVGEAREQPGRTVRDAIGSLPPAGQSGDPLHDHGEQRSDRVALIVRAIPKDGGSRRDLGGSNQLKCHTGFDGFKDVYGRMSWDRPAPTITGGCVNPSKGRFLHPTEDRSITLREAALLQTFPPDHYFSLRRGKFPVAELIGNALPPRLIQAQAESVIRHLRRRGRLGRSG